MAHKPNFVLLDYIKAQAGIMACAKGVISNVQDPQAPIQPPIDLTVDNDRYIPVFRSINKLNLTGADFNTTGRNPTVAIGIGRGFKFNISFAQYYLPAHYAKNLHDMMEYDSLPGLACITQMETSIAGALQLETVTFPAIVQRLLDYYGIKTFRRLAGLWWGGYRDETFVGKYQRMTGTLNSTIDNDISKNIIFPRIKILLPIPSCVLFNREKYNYFLTIESPVEWKFIFRPITNIMTYTKSSTPTDFSDTIEVYSDNITPNEYGNFWTNLDYTTYSENPYYFIDHYMETNSKSFNLSQELRMQFKPSLTWKLAVWISPKDWAVGLDFFGSTVISSASNMIGSLVTPITANTNPAFTFNLNTGLWANGTAVSGNLSIVGWAANAVSFQIVWQRTTTALSIVTISSSTPFGTFGDLYMDLATFSQSPNNTISNVTQLGGLFYTSAIRLNILPYVPTVPGIQNVEIGTLTYGPAKKLARGFWTFNPNVGNVNQHAFWGVTNIVPSALFQPTDFAFDYFFSQPVPNNHTANTLAVANWVRLNKNMHPFYDLDCKWRLSVQALYLEKQSSNTEQLFETELELYRDSSVDEHRWRGQIELLFGYKDQRDPNKNTYGYQDFRMLDLLTFLVRLNTIKIAYDGLDLTDTLKDYNANQKEVEITVVQSSHRLLKYYHGQIAVVPDDEREAINMNIISNSLLPNGLFVVQKPQLEQQTMMRSIMPPMQDMQRSIMPHRKRRNMYDSQRNDELSVNNTMLSRLPQNMPQNMPSYKRAKMQY